MKVNRKGFTLVELLVVIVVVSLVIGAIAYGIIGVINNSKSKANLISESTLFETARIYSGEAASDSWKNVGDYDAFCVTVGELMNKGLLDKNANNDTNDFIIVKRNNVTLAIEKEEMARVGSENYNICTGQSFNTSETITAPRVVSSTSYTDKIVVNFESGNAKYLEGETETISEVSYSCLYGNSSSSVNMVGKIEDNKCILEGLNNNENYYAMIYMNTNHDSTVLAEGENNFMTSDFKDTSVLSSERTLNITFYNTDNNSNFINNPSYYFKSTVSGTTDVNVRKCAVHNNVFTCDNSTTSVEQGIWYKVDDLEVNINYTATIGDIDIITRTYDGSNNFKENYYDFSLKTVTVKFYKDSVDSIDGIDSEYIEKSCFTLSSTSSSGSCSILSPAIVRDGWTVIGWNTSNTATSSSWTSGSSNSVSEDATYYPVTEKVVTISFDKNSAGSIGSESESCTMYNANTSCTITSPSITRDDWTVVGWGTSSTSTSSSWNAEDSLDVSEDATYYAITSKSITVTFDGNNGTVDPTSKQCTMYNGNSVCSISMPTASRSGFSFVGWGTSATSTSSSYDSGSSYDFDANKTLYAIWIVSCSDKSGSKDFSANNGYTIRINWSKSCNSDGTSQFSIDSMQAKSGSYTGVWYYVNGTIYVNGKWIQDCDNSVKVGWFEETGVWYDIRGLWDNSTEVSGTIVTVSFEKPANKNWSGFFFVNDDYRSGQFYISNGKEVEIDIS